ncbi:FAD-dependent oxidoreductase [Kitasatospora sp. NPDC058444]|uniref:FAD-dependent oxidoreductase n=1 Tax=Kitasatospora sp. NPDC058444 TaxID=3346504 RepID=UPI003662D84D
MAEAGTAADDRPARPARVAVVGPFSGPRAAWGELLEHAAAAHDGVRWEFHDDRGDAIVAREVAETIAADGGHALVVGHFNSAGARLALPVYRSAGLPLLLPLATAPRLLDGPAGAALRWCPDDLAQLVELRSAVREAGHTRLAVVDDGGTYGAVLAQLLRGLPADGLRLVDVAEADALVVCGTHVGAAREARARRAAGFPGTLYFTDDCAVDEFPGLLGDAGGTASVVRLRGGAPAYVESTLATAAAVLTARPELTGTALLEALRAHADRRFTPEGDPEPSATGPGWEVVPLDPPPSRPAAAQHGAGHDGSGHDGAGHHGKTYDVLVIGAGVLGSATADLLARQGLRVAMTAPSAEDPAATRYSGGLVRAYEADPALRELALRSHRLAWREGAARRGPSGFRRTGSLVLLGEADLDEAAKGVAELTGAGIEAALLAPRELDDRFPGLRTQDVAGAVWEPGGGYADPAAACLGYRQEAATHGAFVLPGRVRRLDRRPDHVQVTLEQGEAGARAVVLAAGAGTPWIRGHGLSATAEAPVATPRTKRIRYAFFRLPGNPATPTVTDLVTGLWARPQHTGLGAGGWLVGRPVDEWDVPPGGADAVTAAQAEHIREAAVRRWPGIERAEFLGGRHGVDLFTADGRPLIGRDPSEPRLVFATGGSGAGFKTAPAVAESAAAHVVEALG